MLECILKNIKQHSQWDSLTLYKMTNKNFNLDVKIRPFVVEDTKAVLQIVADTAFFGEPVENFLEDRHLFCDVFYRYYTTFQSKNCWVAMSNQNIVGFLAGCLETKTQVRRWVYSILPTVLKKMAQNKYRIGPLTWRYLFGLIRMQFMEESHGVDLSVYPAHLHINVETNWRGRGIGEKLLKRYIEQLSQEHISGVHLNTTDQNRSACRLYDRMGFQLLASKSTRLWSHLIALPVERRCYGLRLANPEIYSETKISQS